MSAGTGTRARAALRADAAAAVESATAARTTGLADDLHRAVGQLIESRVERPHWLWQVLDPDGAGELGSGDESGLACGRDTLARPRGLELGLLLLEERDIARAETGRSNASERIGLDGLLFDQIERELPRAGAPERNSHVTLEQGHRLRGVGQRALHSGPGRGAVAAAAKEPIERLVEYQVVGRDRVGIVVGDARVGNRSGCPHRRAILRDARRSDGSLRASRSRLREGTSECE